MVVGAMGNTVETTSRTTIVAIMASVVLLGAGGALQGTVIALRGGLEGFSSPTIGLIMSSYFVGFILGSFLVVGFVREVGYVRTFAAFASVASATVLAHLLVINPLAWLLFRMLHGVSLSGMLVVVESWLNASTSSYNRGRVLSMYSLVYLAAMGAGQPLISLFPPESFEIFAVTSILMSLCLVPVTLAQVTGTPEVGRRSVRLWETFRRAPLATIGVLVSGMSAEALWGLAPRYGQQIELSTATIGGFMLTLSIGALALQWPLGWLSDHRDRRLAILLAAGVGAAAAGGLALYQGGRGGLFGLAFLIGAFVMPLYSLSLAMVNDQLTPGEMVQAASALIVFYGVGSALGPYTASLAMSRLGPRGLFGFIGVILASYTLFDLVRLQIAPRLQARHREGYRAYPRTTFAAFSLLKRAGRRAQRQEPPADEKDEVNTPGA